MQKYWDCQTFKNREPNKFNSLGNQFINRLPINIKEIIKLFSIYQFSQSSIYLIEISCQSKMVYAEQLFIHVGKLRNQLDQYMEEIEGIMQITKSFEQQQQKQAATLLIDIIEIARLTINDWQQFNNLVQQKDLFEQEINQIRQIYHIETKKEGLQCQII